MKLKDLQSEIFDSIQIQNTPQSDHIVVSTNNGLSATERLSVYQQSSYLKPYSCLSDDFQVTKKFLGEEDFDSLIEDYLEKHPADTHFINECGRHFPDFLQQNYQNKDLPFIYELANLEWLRVISFYNFFDFKKHTAPVDLPNLIEANPSVLILESQWPLDKIWDSEKVHKRKESFLYIWTTEDRQVHCESWDETSKLVLDALLKAKTLDECIESLSKSMDLERLSEIFSKYLSEWNQAGLFEIHNNSTAT